MATGVILFLPISVYFYYLVAVGTATSPLDWALGLVLGVALFYVGIDKLVDWLKDENTPYVFPARCLRPSERKSSEPASV